MDIATFGRLSAELCDLATTTFTLDSFIDEASPEWFALCDTRKLLLSDQSAAMHGYMAVLRERVLLEMGEVECEPEEGEGI
jgi:hypothetical protein